MDTRKDQGDDDRLKSELRRLKRAGAPWYFESELHQRLHGGRPRRSRRRAFNSPSALALSLLVFGSVVIAAYVVVVHMNLLPQGSNKDETAPVPAGLPEAAPALTLPKAEKPESPVLARSKPASGRGTMMDSLNRSVGISKSTEKGGQSSITVQPEEEKIVPLEVQKDSALTDSARILKGRGRPLIREDSLTMKRDSIHVPR